jgi:hypothetical protein
LLSWTASKEGEDENGGSMNVKLSHEEQVRVRTEGPLLLVTSLSPCVCTSKQVEIYHAANVYFDDSLDSVPLEQKNKNLLARAKQVLPAPFVSPCWSKC